MKRVLLLGSIVGKMCGPHAAGLYVFDSINFVREIEMRKFGSLFGAISAGFMLIVLNAAPAHAQATRTWVSGVGDDVNPCSRTAPCKTFAGAISKTAAGGEISVLDPGGFGAVTITKSISIVNDSSGEAGILASSTNGVVVNAGVNDVVILRGLVIDGAPPTSPGLNGIRFLAGRALHVEKCLIKNFVAAAPNGNGINFRPSAASELYVTDSYISTAGQNGLLVQPTGAGSANVLVSRSQLLNNGGAGLRGDGTGSTGGITVSVSDSAAAGNVGGGFTAFSQAAASTKLMLNRVVSSGNGIGLNANGSAAILRIGSSVVSGNLTGVSIASGATLSSYNNNQVEDNVAVGSVMPTIVLR